MSEYHVLFSTDKNYLPYLFVVTQSILDNLEATDIKSQDCLVFHVLIDDSIDIQVFKAYTQAFATFNLQPQVAFRFESHKIDPSVFQGFNLMERESGLTLSPYYRLLFAKVIPSDIHSILYLDIDLLVRADLRHLFNETKLEGKVMTAAITPRAILRSQEPFATVPCLELSPRTEELEPLKIPVKDCIGSGVMLINLEQWRAQNIEQKCIDIGSKWIPPLFDQDILSVACQGQITYMDWDWNMQFSLFKLKELTGWYIQNKLIPLSDLPLYEGAPNLEQLQKMCLNPKIVHFTEIKPWRFPAKISLQEYKWIKDQIIYVQQWISVRNKLQPVFDAVQAKLAHIAPQGFTLNLFDGCYQKSEEGNLLMTPIFKKSSLSVFDKTYII